MIVFKKAISRRAMLRGIGAALALPLLDSMVPAFSAHAATPAKPINRFGVVYVPERHDHAELLAGHRRRRLRADSDVERARAVSRIKCRC